MSALRVLVLCISAALVCTSLRTQHPQIASAVALAAGVGALIISVQDIGSFSKTLKSLEVYITQSGDRIQLFKLCALAMVAEFASDICRDAGEAALAHRIDTAVKLGIVASALPLAAVIMEKIGEMLA